MFERFTERARQVMVLAQEEARMLEHNYVGTEHILLGLQREHEGVAARALEALGITLEGARAQVLRRVGSGHGAPGGEVPFTPRAKKVLQLALREALSLGHNYIATEHILLALNTEDDGVAAIVLREAGADVDKVREEVIGLLSASTPDPLAPPPPRRPDGGLVGTVSEQRLPAQASAVRRFDDAATHAVELALAEALRWDDERITCEHLLAGLAAVEDTLAARLLREHGLDPEALRNELGRGQAP